MKEKKIYWPSRGPITVTVVSKDPLISGIAGSKPAASMDDRLS